MEDVFVNFRRSDCGPEIIDIKFEDNSISTGQTLVQRHDNNVVGDKNPDSMKWWRRLRVGDCIQFTNGRTKDVTLEFTPVTSIWSKVDDSYFQMESYSYLTLDPSKLGKMRYADPGNVYRSSSSSLYPTLDKLKRAPGVKRYGTTDFTVTKSIFKSTSKQQHSSTIMAHPSILPVPLDPNYFNDSDSDSYHPELTRQKQLYSDFYKPQPEEYIVSTDYEERVKTQKSQSASRNLASRNSPSRDLPSKNMTSSPLATKSRSSLGSEEEEISSALFHHLKEPKASYSFQFSESDDDEVTPTQEVKSRYESQDVIKSSDDGEEEDMWASLKRSRQLQANIRESLRSSSLHSKSDNLRSPQSNNSSRSETSRSSPSSSSPFTTPSPPKQRLKLKQLERDTSLDRIVIKYN